MSKIQSESKSQQWGSNWTVQPSCGIYVKDTIWKQITTFNCSIIRHLRLWYLCQRYNLKANHNDGVHHLHYCIVVVSMSKIQSESKSQHGWAVHCDAVSCGIYVKDTIWKQITTSATCRRSSSGCGIYVKDTIWKQITTHQQGRRFWGTLWYLCQRYNLKANHNTDVIGRYVSLVVVSMSKIQSESKSQPARLV